MAAACASHAADTGLFCSRCESVLCAKCLVHTAVGVRCRDCSRPSSNIRKYRPSGGTAAVRVVAGGEEHAGRMHTFGLLAAVFAGYLTFSILRGDYGGAIVKAIVIGGWVFSVSVHELCHGLVAYWGGDRGIRDRGLLTLNPLKFIDPLWGVLLPLVFLMLGGLPLMGGATMVHRHLLRSRGWESAMSAAGPASNLALAVLLSWMVRGGVHAGVFESSSAVAGGLANLAELQVMAALFNMIPWPPLDGFWAAAPFLPIGWREMGYRIGRSGYCLLLMAFWLVPGLGMAFWGQVDEITIALRLPPDALYLGAEAMRFW